MSSPAGSKRYIRLNLNMRGERKITVGAGAAFQNSNHLTFSSHLNNKLLSSFHIFKLLGHRKSKKIMSHFKNILWKNNNAINFIDSFLYFR